MLLAVTGALAGCGGSSHAQPVASVAGQPISASELAHWSAIKRAESSAAGPRAPAGDARTRALEFLITALWLEGEAAARAIRASSAEASATYRELLASAAGPGLTSRLQRLGITPADELRQLRLEQLSLRLRAAALSGHEHASPAVRIRVLDAFVTAFRGRWRRATRCRPGDAISLCVNGPPLEPVRP